LDCSASYKGTSLNQELLQGPDLTDHLVGVLTRFRLEEVAIIADIESMFYQVFVPEKQHHLLRFLWWPDGNLDKRLPEFVMTVHIAVSSPSCENFALKRTATENEITYGTEAADTLHNNFYVDDILKSCKSESEVIELLENVVSMCAR